MFMGTSEGPLTKVTTFKLSPSMTAALDEICARDGATKDSVIREMIRLGMLVDAELQAMTPAAAKKVAARIRRIIVDIGHHDGHRP